MVKHWYCALWSCSLLLLLVACGNTSGSDTQASDNTNSGTQSSGPASIATDHSIYKPSDRIQATVLNTLSTPIYALDTQASCSILSLEMRVNGTWQASSVARCSLGRPAMVVKLDAGKTETAMIQASSPVMKDAVFPAGTYRLVLNYSTSGSATNTLANLTTIYSETFSVAGSAPASTAGSGTPVSPTIVAPPPTP